MSSAQDEPGPADPAEIVFREFAAAAAPGWVRGVTHHRHAGKTAESLGLRS